VHIHVAGGARAGAAAFGDDPGDAVADRGLHHGRADLGLDLMGGAVVLDVGDLLHGTCHALGFAACNIVHVALKATATAGASTLGASGSPFPEFMPPSDWADA